MHSVGHLLHDIPDVTVLVQPQQSVRHRLIVNKGMQRVTKECIRNPDHIVPEEADM